MIKIKSILLAITLLIGLVSFANSDSGDACPTIVMSGTNVSCYGFSNGTANVAISNGSGSYTISWTNGGNTSNITGLAVGTYSVTVKDLVSGCTVQGSYVVTSPTPITISGTITNANCKFEPSGAIDASIVGGTPPYTYSWSNSATSQDISNVIAGTYTLTVTDAKGCVKAKSFTITQPAYALTGSGFVQNASCFASATGSIDLDVNGGTPSYAYSWSSGQTTQDISNLTAGSYDVIVTDSKGCFTNFNFNITQPPVLGGTISKTDVLCYGELTGTVSVSVTGGTGPYSYAWQNSTTLFSYNGPNLSGVKADTYQVTVTDAKGCQFITSIVVNQPPLLNATEMSVNVSCFGGNDGSIDLIPTGGTLPYTYSWSNSGGSYSSVDEDISGLSAETYTVIVTDQNGCQYTLVKEITQPNMPISVTETHQDVLCYGDNTGSIDLTVVGGSPGYAFSWTSGQSTEDISNLLFGNYSYTVIDTKGCTKVGTITIQQPLQPLSVTVAVTNVNCFGESNGVIDLTVNGGTTPYTYTWSNSTYLLSNTNQDLVNYPADDYRFQVTDMNGCKVIDTITITQPQLLTNALVGVNILCKGGNNGSIDQTVAGGVTPYIFTWSNAATTEDLTGLIAGTYSVVVTDDHNCTVQDQITLTEPMDSLEYTYTVKDVLCNDGTDGNIHLTVTGGTIPYFYNWSNGDNANIIVDLTSGYYEFVVTDNNGCVIFDSIFVDQPDALIMNEQITVVSCFGFSDGIIDISPSGGTEPFSYKWYNSSFSLSAQTQDLNGYPADVYQVEIRDSNNCFYESFFEIQQPEKIKIEYEFNIVSCNGGSDGNILVDITGGNPGYNTTWNTGATSEDLLNVSYGEYNLVVVDQKNCTDSISVEIAQPDSISISFEVEEVTCIDQYNGKAFAFPEGGNGGYSYSWTHGGSSFVSVGLENTTYSITITDILGCTGFNTIFIPKNTIDCVDPVNAFSPNGDDYNDTWIIDNMELYPDAHVDVFNRWGNIIYQQKGLYFPWDGNVHGVQTPSDTYYYIINLNKEDREPLIGNITIVR